MRPPSGSWAWSWLLVLGCVCHVEALIWWHCTLATMNFYDNADPGLTIATCSVQAPVKCICRAFYLSCLHAMRHPAPFAEFLFTERPFHYFCESPCPTPIEQDCLKVELKNRRFGLLQPGSAWISRAASSSWRTLISFIVFCILGHF